MSHTGLIITGSILLVISILGFVTPLTDAGWTAPEVHNLCNSGLGQLGRAFSGDLQQICNKYRYVTYGIYAFGGIGIMLLIIGAVKPSNSKTKINETRNEWYCEHCNFKTNTEINLIEHYKEKHPEKKDDSFHKKYDKKISPDNLEILKKRYAQGEITKEEFERMKEELSE